MCTCAQASTCTCDAVNWLGAAAAQLPGSLPPPWCEARPTCHSCIKKEQPFFLTTTTTGFQPSTCTIAQCPASHIVHTLRRNAFTTVRKCVASRGPAMHLQRHHAYWKQQLATAPAPSPAPGSGCPARVGTCNQKAWPAGRAQPVTSLSSTTNLNQQELNSDLTSLAWLANSLLRDSCDADSARQALP